MNVRSLGGQNGSLTILLYHRILPELDPILRAGFHAGIFGRQLDILKRFYRVLPLSEALERLELGRLPGRSVCITFDDGYADNCTVALPMLVERGLHATFFITTGYLDGGIMWNDIVHQCVRQAGSLKPFKPYLPDGERSAMALTKPEVIEAMQQRLKHEEPGKRQGMAEELAESLGTKIPTDLMMSSEQVRILADAGMEIGAHTLTHPILSRISSDHAWREISDSKRVLEEILGRGVNLFAYPNGVPEEDFSEKHIQMVRNAGFSAAVTTSPGTADKDIDRFQLPRYAPWSIRTGRFIVHHWRNARKTPRLIEY